MSKSCYYETHAEAIDALDAALYEAGTVLDPNWQDEVHNRGHIAYGTTQTFDWPIIEARGKRTRKYFHAAIYRMESGRYEVTSYVL